MTRTLRLVLPALAFGLALAATHAGPAFAEGAPQAAAEAQQAAAGVASACPRNAPTVDAAAQAEDAASMTGRLKGALASGNFVFALLLVLVGGFLTALSPCVYPLIPITLSIFGARQASSHLQGFLLAATYVGGMVILYAGLGVGLAAAGSLAGSAMQSPIITVGVALLCVVMAASMFGAFEMVLPSSLQTRLSQAGGSGFKGAFIMGLVAGIIAAPCTGPVLSFVLTLIARDGDIAKGGILMVFYALGMGLPFLVLGTFSQAIGRMPKSGKWMEVVKSVFGLMMLGAALYFLRLGVPSLGAAMAPLGGTGWIGPLLLLAGIGAGALHLSFKMSALPEKLRKALGVTLSTAGIVVFIAWATAAEAPAGDVPSTEAPIAWHVVKNATDAVEQFDAALQQAKASCHPVMIDFFAEWCIACKELDKHTYSTDEVRREARRFVSVKVDATDESPALAALQTRFGVVGLPTVAFIDGSGAVTLDPRVTGFVPSEDYVKILKRVR